MNLTCPCCHARYSLDAMLQDEAARDLLGMRGDTPPQLWNPLIAYLGLFRSESRALPWDKALKLSREVFDLARNLEPGMTAWEKLETALVETVDSLRQKGGKPLKNHNYLKRVLENQPSTVIRRESRQMPTAATSKRSSAIAALEEWGQSDWLRSGIAAGLAALVARSLKGQPGADIITLTADTWFVTLKRDLTIEEIDAGRLGKGFEKLLADAVEWPQPKQLMVCLPSRPYRQGLPAPRPTDEEYAAGQEKARELAAKFGN